MHFWPGRLLGASEKNINATFQVFFQMLLLKSVGGKSVDFAPKEVHILFLTSREKQNTERAH